MKRFASGVRTLAKQLPAAAAVPGQMATDSLSPKQPVCLRAVDCGIAHQINPAAVAATMAQLQQMVSVCQQFITVMLYYTQRVDDAVIAGTRVLGQLYAANESATAQGRRTNSVAALDYHAFYNDAVNQDD